jgi:hypothetical protein
VLHQSYILGNSSTISAINLDMNVRVVQRVKQTFKATGEVCEDRKGIGRLPLLTIGAIEVNEIFTMSSDTNIQFQHMLGLLEHSPDLYLDEIQEEMWVKHAIDVSLSTVCHTLKRLGITSKKVIALSDAIIHDTNTFNSSQGLLPSAVKKREGLSEWK